MNKYPIYIISKGRWENPLTAKCFLKDKVLFKIVVEPQEYPNYCNVIPKKYIIKLPFKNLELGSYPARNFCWKDSIRNGYKRHWVFDDNIRSFGRLNKGKRIEINADIAIQIIEDFTDRYENIGISGFNYLMFVPNTTQHPVYTNTHVYSALLIKNDMPYRWRLKYNEDVDLCLQVLTNKLCTVLFNMVYAVKTSTTVKMKGGNQTELYKDNAFEKKVLKAKSLESIWPNHVKTVYRFHRPHHQVSWKKLFKHTLIRRTDINWDNLKPNEFGMKLVKLKKNLFLY